MTPAAYLTADPFASLSFIAGPAILTNACAVMQNGTTTRYSLAIGQWRELRASIATQDQAISQLYTAPEAVLALAARRIRLQLGGMAALGLAVALFATATLVGLAGAVLRPVLHLSADAIALTMAAAGTAALLALLAAVTTFLLENACAGALLRLRRIPQTGELP